MPQRPCSSSVVPLVIALQTEPSKCKIVPLVPPLYTFLDEVPHTLDRFCVVPLVIGVQLAPSNRKIVPRGPTANTSDGELPQTAPVKSALVPLVIGLQLEPL